MYRSCLDLTEHKFVTEEHKFENFWCSRDRILTKYPQNSSNPVV